MISIFIRYLRGYLLIRIQGDSIERFINLCRYQNIHLWGLQSQNHCYEMYLSIHDFRKLRQIRRKTGIHLEIIRKIGFPFVIHHYANRKLFFAGFFIFCACLFYFCQLIWSIQLDGNQYYTDETLTSFLKFHGIQTRMKCSSVDCEEIVRMFRTNFDDIVWVSASLEGTCLKIQIKENSESASSSDSVHSTSKVQSPKDIVATKEGTITEIMTREGVPQCHEGDNVKQGDVLVSGSVPIKNDADEIIDYQLQESDADIYASTTYAYEDTITHAHKQKKYQKEKFIQWNFIFDHTILTISPFMPRQSSSQTASSKQSQEQHEIHSKRYTFPLLEQLSVPFQIDIKSIHSYTYQTKKDSKEEIRAALSANFHQFCDDLEKKGVVITANNVKINLGVSASTAKGTIFTIEKIGVPKEAVVPEQERILTE